MRKNLGYILFSLILCFMLINNVMAEDINFELKLSNSSNEFIKGSYADIKLSVNTLNDKVIDYCTFIVEASEKLEFKEIQALNSWTLSNNNVSGNVIDINIKNNQSSLNGLFNIASLRYTVNGNGNVKISSSMCYDKNGDILSSSDTKTVEILVSDNKNNYLLKSLKINNQELNPKFSPNVTSYNINNFNADSISLEYELNDLTYQDQVVVTVNGKTVTDLNYIPYELTEGNNSMLVSVNIANSNTYNIFVYKQLNNSYDNSLSSLTVNGEMIEIVSGKYDYTYTVADDVTNVEVLATLSDEGTFRFDNLSNAPGTFSLTDKVIAIMNVVPQNQQSGVSSVTYTLTVVNEKNAASLINPEAPDNPKTGDTSMYIMAIILFMSLVGSVVLYQKNINGYK